jgi:thiamine transport system ATP-binding protein
LARVLLADRPVVLLDEPFAALGPGLKDEMLDLVQSTLGVAGRTVLMVTHDPDDARRIADQASLVAAGTVSAPVETRVFFEAPSPALSAYLG